MIRILIAEDQAMLRGALTALLGMESDIEVLGAAPDGETAWRELQKLKPDLLVESLCTFAEARPERCEIRRTCLLGEKDGQAVPLIDL